MFSVPTLPGALQRSWKVEDSCMYSTPVLLIPSPAHCSILCHSLSLLLTLSHSFSLSIPLALSLSLFLFFSFSLT